MKEKEKWKIYKDVFDESTMKAISKLASDGYIELVQGVIATGKEANVYLGKAPDGKEIALKIYRYETSSFNTMSKYIKGDNRFASIKMKKRDIVKIWAKKEFKNLELACKAGVRVPKPVIVRDNILIMEFIGENGNSAPTAKHLPPKEPKIWLQKVLNSIRALYIKERLIHGDLSEYNILNFDEEPVIIDMGQGVLTDHPAAEELLKKDIINILKWFKKLGVEVPDAEKVYYDIMREAKQNGRRL
jgi:RIO kinase 1